VHVTHIIYGGRGYSFLNFTMKNDGTGIMMWSIVFSVAVSLQTLVVYDHPMKYRPVFTWIQHNW
jgi:hypothetical protein